MSLFKFLSKNKQEAASAKGVFRTRAEEESSAVRARNKRSSAKNSVSEDIVLPEKKRARRRLIGAVALVLAAVIGLPMVLDTEPKPLADDISIQIPAMDKPVHPDSSRQSASSSAKADLAVVEVPPSATDTEDVKHATLPAKENDRGKLAAVDANPIKVPQPNSVSKSQKQAGKLDESVRAKAILEGRAEPKVETRQSETKAVAEKKSGQYIIQVAALASQEKVLELQGRLKSAGIASHTQKVATQAGDRIRVRVGPFAAKEDADKMRAKLQKIGLAGTLVPL